MNSISSAQQFFDYVINENVELLSSSLSSLTKEECIEIFTDKKTNILQYAIDSGRFHVCAIIITSLSVKVLNKVVLVTDPQSKPIYSVFFNRFKHFAGSRTFEALYAKLGNAHFRSKNLLEFRDLDFKNALAQNLFLSIKENNLLNLNLILEPPPKQELKEALFCQDEKRGTTILAFAAHIDNLEALDALIKLDVNYLAELMTQKDHLGWTPFHHVALLNDNGSRYKHLKEKTGLDPKSITDYFCESPFMLRKYIKAEPSRFSADGTNCLYVMDEGEEKHLSVEEFKRQYAPLLTKTFKTFKFIPHAKPKIFKSFWAIGLKSQRSEKKLRLLDQHLKVIYEAREETGLALTPVNYTDDEKSIPAGVNLGLGVKARRDFQIGEIVTSYGGQQFLPHHEVNGESVYRYASTEYCNTAVDGLDYRSYGSMVQHSAPNVRFWDINTLLGINVVALRAIESIPEKTYVCLNYGKIYFSYLNIVPVEIRPKARERMISQPSVIYTTYNIQKHYLEYFG